MVFMESSDCSFIFYIKTKGRIFIKKKIQMSLNMVALCWKFLRRQLSQKLYIGRGASNKFIYLSMGDL